MTDVAFELIFNHSATGTFLVVMFEQNYPTGYEKAALLSYIIYSLRSLHSVFIYQPNWNDDIMSFFRAEHGVGVL